MRLDRPAALTAIAAVAVAMMPLQGVALLRSGTGSAGINGTAAASAFTQTATASTAMAATLQRTDMATRTSAATAKSTQTAQKAPSDPAYDAFAQRWPAQAAATEDLSQPDTTRWALLIGINEHSTSVTDNQGSAQDAQDLREFLLTQGWRDDHIVLINDYDATRDNMMAGMTWLAKKTTKDSVAIFHYSGHSKKWYDQDYDGDGEITDEGLWPSDGKFIVDSEMVRQLSGVQAGKFWISIGACNSEGFNDPGLLREGRLLTFSSAESEKSYEDPSVHNSVYGYYFFEEGLKQGFSDTNGDGKLTVEEMFAWAKPRANTRTEGQKYGNQNAVMYDQVAGDFDFAIPAPPKPEPKPEPSADPSDDEEEAQGSGGLLCPWLCEQR